MSYNRIPGKEAVMLIRALGILVHQAGIYGSTHNVTLNAARCVFIELSQAVRTYGPIEIAVTDNLLLVNGSADGLDAGIGKNLLDRMIIHKIGGLVFLPPLDMSDFIRCVNFFGAQPVQLEAEGGFETAMNRAGLNTVRVVKVAYRRVADEESEKTVVPVLAAKVIEKASVLPVKPEEESVKPLFSKNPASRGGTGAVHALSMAWELDEETNFFGTVEREGTAQEARKRRALELASLLRETASLLEEHNEQLSEAEQHQNVVLALNRIRRSLVDATGESERNIAALASQMDKDRETVEHIELDARQRGIGLELSRSELVERYAELNQEIIQPLTVSTGVLDLLQSGKGGSLTEAQLDMLKLAFDSVERVNQLVAFLSRVAGLPNSLTPNAVLLAETFR